MLDSPYASEGTRTGFYVEDHQRRSYRRPEELRRASLRWADLRDCCIDDTDFYLVDLRGAMYSAEQGEHFRKCGAIL